MPGYPLFKKAPIAAERVRLEVLGKSNGWYVSFLYHYPQPKQTLPNRWLEHYVHPKIFWVSTGGTVNFNWFIPK